MHGMWGKPTRPSREYEWSALFTMQGQLFSKRWRFVLLHAEKFEEEEDLQEEKRVFGKVSLDLLHMQVMQQSLIHIRFRSTRNLGKQVLH